MSWDWDFLDKYTYDNILASMLNRVDAKFDKREGAVLYDAMAPAALELSKLYEELRDYYKNTFASTAEGNWLDLRTAEAGVTRKGATAAERKVTFTATDGSVTSIPIGTQYTTIDGNSSLTYTIRANTAPGVYTAVCDTLGRVGNDYYGELQNVTDPDLRGTATMSDILVEGIDEESDEDLYRRYILALTSTPFGGSFADYKTKVLEQQGVAAVQIYPNYNWGGTVKLVILNENRVIPSADVVERVQEAICPYSLADGRGWAPIGHNVVVKAADAVEINIAANITLDEDGDIDTIQTAAEEAFEEYLVDIRKGWDNELKANRPVYRQEIYWSQFYVKLMMIPGVKAVDDLMINGSADSRTVFREDSDVQEIPILGEVKLVAVD